MTGGEGWLPLDIRIRQWSGAPSLLACRCASGLRGLPGPLRLMCPLLGGVMGSELPSEGFSLGSQVERDLGGQPFPRSGLGYSAWLGVFGVANAYAWGVEWGVFCWDGHRTPPVGDDSMPSLGARRAGSPRKCM